MHEKASSAAKPLHILINSGTRMSKAAAEKHCEKSARSETVIGHFEGSSRHSRCLCVRSHPRFCASGRSARFLEKTIDAWPHRFWNQHNGQHLHNCIRYPRRRPSHMQTLSAEVRPAVLSHHQLVLTIVQRQGIGTHLVPASDQKRRGSSSQRARQTRAECQN